jgi:Ca2+-binding RTX toxin-like protein
VLKGEAGADAFVFNVPVTTANRDKILDFNVAADVFWLDNAVFATIGPNGALAAAAFQAGASSAAANANVRIVYNTTNGQLFYDSDGSGAGASVHFATLSAGLALTNADFLVI